MKSIVVYDRLKRIACLFSLAVVIFFVPNQMAQGEETHTGHRFHIYATAWGTSLAIDGTGFYNDLARLVLGPLMADIRYDLIPYRRANRIFNEDKTACHYPSNLNYLLITGIVKDSSNLIQTDSLIRTVARVFAPYDIAPPTKVEDADGKSIAYTMGAEIPVLFKGHGRRFIPVANEVDKAEMLITGRVDLMVGYTPDIILAYRDLGQPVPPFDPSFTINAEYNAIVCHKAPETELLVAQVNERFRTLVQTGELAAFLSRNKLDPASYIPAPEGGTARGEPATKQPSDGQPG